MIQLDTEPENFQGNEFMKMTDPSALREILSSLAAVSVLVEDFRRELRRGVVVERAGSASSSTP
jgi:molybdopterin-guanine dinucleotide biosynthesis protein